MLDFGEVSYLLSYCRDQTPPPRQLMEELIWAYGSEGKEVHTVEEGVMLQEKGPPASNSKQEAEEPSLVTYFL